MCPIKKKEDNTTPKSSANQTIPAQPVSTAGRQSGFWHLLLGEPLVLFFVVGAIVFGAYWFFNLNTGSDKQKQIEISANDIRQIAISWLAQGRALPTKEQLQSLIEQQVKEEVLFREGLELGLDRNDEIIKRRVAQKMDFLAADIASMQAPDTAELKNWFSENSNRFTQPPRISFRHLYFSPDKRGRAAQTDASMALEEIEGKAADSSEMTLPGDPFMLRSYYSSSTPGQMLKEFGPSFATEIFKLEPGGWRGPVQSGLGWHLVWVEVLSPARVPGFEEVEADVRSAWIDDRYLEVKRTALSEMRARYKVVIAPLDNLDLQNLRGSDKINRASPELITP